MTEHEFEIQIGRLCANSGRRETKGLLEEWWKALGRYPEDAVKGAVDEWIEMDNRFPTIGALRQLIKKRTPSADDMPEDIQLTEAETAFGAVAMNLLGRRLRGRISASEWFYRFKQAAIDNKIENTIDWEYLHDPATGRLIFDAIKEKL